jgi:PadR family transcriptional regulator, regulatory protein PadR
VPRKLSDMGMSSTAAHRDLYSGLIRLHILYHACKAPIFGLEMIEELGRHGYKLSAGTMYPLLHGLEEKGFLRRTVVGVGRSRRHIYRATPGGRKALAIAKEKVQELFSELFEDVIRAARKTSRRRKHR